MQYIRIKTRTLNPPQDDIYRLFDESVRKLQERDILLVTSKILSIHQGRAIAIDKIKDKDQLIIKEADSYIERKKIPRRAAVLTVKNHTLSPSAGIDESNARGYYLLWPRDIYKEAKKIRAYFRKKFNLRKLGVIITDSHCVPLRYGVVGVAIGFAGLKPLRDYRGTKDIFGRELIMTQANVVDAIAAMGVLLMGEGKEKTPMVILRDPDPLVEFTNRDCARDLFIPRRRDIFYPLLKQFKNKK